MRAALSRADRAGIASVAGLHDNRNMAPELVDRFRAELERLACGEGLVALAVSGGADSLALLLLAAAALPDRVAAATVDHGLRTEAAEEAAYVASLCARIGCPHATLRVQVAPGGAGVQGEARQARYDALTGWARDMRATALATAHHRDDQAETVLMRLMRGAGARGLAGIRPRRNDLGVPLIRPLLGWGRRELQEIVAGAGLSAIDDPSNHDPRYDRTRARRLLARHPELDPARLSRSAAALRDADEALDWSMAALAAERVRPAPAGYVVDPRHLPRELRRRLLAEGLKRVRHGKGPMRGLDRLLDVLDGGGSGTLAGVAAASDEGTWMLRPAPPRRGEDRGAAGRTRRDD